MPFLRGESTSLVGVSSKTSAYTSVGQWWRVDNSWRMCSTAARMRVCIASTTPSIKGLSSAASRLEYGANLIARICRDTRAVPRQCVM